MSNTEKNQVQITSNEIVNNIYRTDEIATMRKHVTEMFISYLLHNDCENLEEKHNKYRTYTTLDFALEEIGNLKSKKTA